MTVYSFYYSDELYHHGILGQKWGQKNGPPYPLSGGQLSGSEKRKRYIKINDSNTVYNKRHFDERLKAGTTLSTLSYDKNRIKNADMYYATYRQFDKHQYNVLFNKKIPQDITDENGNVIGSAEMYKFKINTRTKTSMKVASEDSGSEIFLDLYKKNRDFYNFVTDPKRMQSYFVSDKYKFRGYRESKKVLDKLKDPNYIPTKKEASKLYRMFNYTIPYDGAGDPKKGNDMRKQRAKFFNECKKKGYGAILDTNDAIYGGFKARAPVIVFDMSQIFEDKVYRTSAASKQVSAAALAFRKMAGV